MDLDCCIHSILLHFKGSLVVLYMSVFSGPLLWLIEDALGLICIHSILLHPGGALFYYTCGFSPDFYWGWLRMPLDWYISTLWEDAKGLDSWSPGYKTDCPCIMVDCARPTLFVSLALRRPAQPIVILSQQIHILFYNDEHSTLD